MTARVGIDDGVALVTLDRPQAMNSIDAEMRQALGEIWRGIANDPTIRVMVITGAGERAFCTGADLKGASAEVSAAAQGMDTGPGHLLGTFPWDVPSLCAINGYALGGGLEIALACDIRIAADHARLGLTEVKVGSIPGAGGTQLLPRIVGRAAALRMTMTGEHVDAHSALGMGLVSEVCPLDELLNRARELAKVIADNAPLAVRAVKRLVSTAEDLPLDRGLEAERTLWGLLRDTKDRQEGRLAFREKRKANYQGM